MNEKARQEYERMLEQVKRYERTGNRRVFTRTYRLAKLDRCPVCFTVLIEDGYCYPCGAYRSQR